MPKEGMFTRGFKKRGVSNQFNSFFEKVCFVGHMSYRCDLKSWQCHRSLNKPSSSMHIGPPMLGMVAFRATKHSSSASSALKPAPSAMPMSSCPPPLPISQNPDSAVTVLEAPLQPFAESHDSIESVASATQIKTELVVVMRHGISLL